MGRAPELGDEGGEAGPIEICIFSYYFPPHLSGAGFCAVRLTREFRARGIGVLFAAVDNTGLPRRDIHDGFDVHRGAESAARTAG
jgi:hypothetical protein